MNKIKWKEYIKSKDQFIDIKKIVENYSKPIKNFILSDKEDPKIVLKQIEYLENKQKINNYAHHKNGYIQLKKLINGWLLEDFIRVMLKKVDCKINGTDIKREIKVKPTNEPDLVLKINDELCYVEVTNINFYGKNKKIIDEINSLNKFKNLKWWQGRAWKYHRLHDLAKNNKSVFLINVVDNFDGILIKKIVKSNRVLKEPKYKWYSYSSSAISLGNEYYSLKLKGLELSEISDIIISNMKKLLEGKYDS